MLPLLLLAEATAIRDVRLDSWFTVAGAVVLGLWTMLDVRAFQRTGIFLARTAKP
ncbi:hypothetical protein [Arthrobacter sp. NyZ413]|uniref:hypothetical protein n=1 Tax=Arthrobacter sp. NyZ413 TaxID=3144669 RepID=UPI002CAE7D22|nr:hypothetical protein [Arthrobacter sp.]